MEKIIIYIILLVLCSTSGCKSGKTTVEHRTLSVSDTTHLLLQDSSTSSTTEQCTSTHIDTENGSVVEFIEGGGTVRIDTAGNVLFEGVATVRNRSRATLNQSEEQSSQASTESSYLEQQQAVTFDSEEHIKEVVNQSSGVKWYEKPFTKLGQGVFIALLLWTLFIYLRQKK